MTDLKTLYNRKYSGESWQLYVPRPDAITTTRYDDVTRLLRGESGRILEVGCGAGQFLLALADQFDELDGFDLASVRVELAQGVLAERYPDLVPRVHFKAASLDQTIPYEDKTFDVVLACAVIEHVVDIFGAVDEVARVTKPGGCAVIVVPNICYVKHVFGMLVGRVPLTGSPVRSAEYWREHGWDGGHLHYFSKQILADLLRNSGFEPEAWTGDGKWAKLRRWNQNFVGNLTVRARRR